MLAAVLDALGGGSNANTRSLPHWVIPLIITSAVFTRIAVSTHPHSGEANPPFFGDYEAQRHWMEITVHTPLREWYVQTKDNDLSYWGLDYPPLSAYQALVYGWVIGYFNPLMIALSTSRGFESYDSKLLMRYSVIVSDILFLLPALYLFLKGFQEKVGGGNGKRTSNSKTKNLIHQKSLAFVIAVAAFNPAQILVDHGHFQYNCISLGLTVYAATCVIHDWDVMGSILFTLALNHKQMSMYFAPAFFAYLLGKHLRNGSVWVTVQKVLKLGITVIGTFAVIWAPFYLAVDPKTGAMDKWTGVWNVFQRLIPFKRGLYEDYVSNFWCATNPLFRWKNVMSVETAAKVALLGTNASIMPSVLHQIQHPSKEGFVWCLTNCAFGFFLFSFQVHEKSALLFLTPALLLTEIAPDFSTWLPIVVSFSMWPLLRKDNLLVAYLGVVLAFAVLVDGGVPGGDDENIKRKKRNIKGGGQFTAWLSSVPEPTAWRVVRWNTLIGLLVLHFVECTMQTPKKLPYLHDLLCVSFCFLCFACAALYCNWRQRQVPADVEMLQNAMVKRSTRAGKKTAVHSDDSDDGWSLVKFAASPAPRARRRKKA